MIEQTTQARAQWSSLYTYLLVTTGAVIGLGNIFQFPYFVNQYGSTFILFYILFELLIALPILLSEIIIGRHGKQNPVGSISILSLETNANSAWRYIGWLCFIILFISLCFYSVQVAIPLDYAVDLLRAQFHLGGTGKELLTNIETTAHPVHLSLYFTLFLLATILVIIRGINRGLENICKIVMPLFFLTFLGLAIYACSTGAFKAAVLNLVDFRLNTISFNMLFAAFAFAFYKLNIGMGCMIVYGSYLPYTAPLGRSTLMVAGLDVLVSLLAYLIIYPLLLLHTPISGATSLSYYVIPTIFANSNSGVLLASLFFLATALAAWMPTIAFAESTVVILIERLQITRRLAAILVGLGGLLLGMLYVLSYSKISLMPFFNLETFNSKSQDFINNILIPLSALFIIIFTSWIVNKDIIFAELGFKTRLCKIWLFLARFVIPITLIILLISSVMLILR